MSKYDPTFCRLLKKHIDGHKKSECRGCTKVYASEQRKILKNRLKNHKTYLEKYKGRNIESARSKVFVKVRAGVMPKASYFLCVDCGKNASEYDHRDYNKPLDVVPVCRLCNQKRGPGLNRDIIVPCRTTRRIKKIENFSDSKNNEIKIFNPLSANEIEKFDFMFNLEQETSKIPYVKNMTLLMESLEKLRTEFKWQN